MKVKKRCKQLFVVCIALLMCLCSILFSGNSIDCNGENGEATDSFQQIVNAEQNLDWDIVNTINSNQVVSIDSNDFDLVRFNISSQSTDFININETVPLLTQNNKEKNYLPGYDPTYTDEENAIDDNEQLPISPSGVVDDENEMRLVTNHSQSPYRYMVFLVAEYSVYDRVEHVNKTVFSRSSGFFVGSNVLMASGHALLIDVTNAEVKPNYEDNINNPVFPDKVFIYPQRHFENGTEILPYGEFEVEEIYLQKEYYQNRPNFSSYTNEEAFYYDWSVLTIDEEIGLETGFFGMSTSSGTTSLQAVGYSDENSNDMELYYSYGDRTSQSEYLYGHNATTTEGFSGGPLIGMNYPNEVIGIQVGFTRIDFNSSNWAMRINDLIVDLVRNLRQDMPIKIKNFYYDGSNIIQYNCATQFIYFTSSDRTLQLKRADNGNYVTIDVSKQEFYSPTINSNEPNVPYSHYRLISGSEVSDDIEIGYGYSYYDTLALYPVKRRSVSRSTIATSYDQSGNVWDHDGSSSNTIKGTIVYNGEAKNIEVEIPWLGTAQSDEVQVGGRTFRLRAGPNRVSIKADVAVTCTETTVFFAFATV